MPVNFVEPRVARWAVQRQNALIAAEEVLREMVRIKSILDKPVNKPLTKKQDAEVRKMPGLWAKAENCVKELDRTHPKQWDKSAV